MMMMMSPSGGRVRHDAAAVALPCRAGGGRHTQEDGTLPGGEGTHTQRLWPCCLSVTAERHSHVSQLFSKAVTTMPSLMCRDPVTAG